MTAGHIELVRDASRQHVGYAKAQVAACLAGAVIFDRVDNSISSRKGRSESIRVGIDAFKFRQAASRNGSSAQKARRARASDDELSV